jgi:YjbE family integral membrane protein
MPLLEYFDVAFFTGLLSIVMIDLVLAGDNSIVIAMAVQSLPSDKRFKGILLGALAAVLLRVTFTFFASKMLLIPFVKLIGGALILWIAVKLMTGTEGEHKSSKSATTIWSAVWIILVADVTMSLDNILAVAGASHGNLGLLLFGLGLSIPLVVFASAFIAKLMDRFPIIMWIGAIILGKVGGEMMITDPIVVSRLLSAVNLVEHKGLALEANHYVIWSVELLAAAAVLLVALLLRRTAKAAKTA